MICGNERVKIYIWMGDGTKGNIPKPNDTFVSGLKLGVLWST